ncbi:hypothetical protein D3C72_1408660 [compost metagenome]
MSIRCPHCNSQNPSSDSRALIIAAGAFTRKIDQSRHQRFRCKPCKKTFSTASFHPCYRQKKRHLNPQLFELFVSGVSQRRLGKILKVNRKTIIRKFIFMGILAHHYFKMDREQGPRVHEMEFDDLETFEYSKMKPVSVTMALESGSRRILGFRVAQMPAKGLLAKRSLKKYGPRNDERKTKREDLFREIRDFVAPSAVIKSDENPHYESDVRRFFPQGIHIKFKGRRGCVVGQGELKAGGFDPIFSLNHSFAMFRANINRLFRRSWNTTKRKDRLALQIAMYSLYHNLHIIHNPSV